MMKRVTVSKAWELVKQFEDDGVIFFTREGEGKYTRISNLPDLLRYQYRLFVSIKHK